MNSDLTRLFPKQQQHIFSIHMYHQTAQLMKFPTASEFQASHILYKEFTGSSLRNYTFWWRQQNNSQNWNNLFRIWHAWLIAYFPSLLLNTNESEMVLWGTYSTFTITWDAFCEIFKSVTMMSFRVIFYLLTAWDKMSFSYINTAGL